MQKKFDLMNFMNMKYKNCEEMKKVYGKQLLTHLKLTKMKLGLLVNFGEILIKDGIKRVVNGLED